MKQLSIMILSRDYHVIINKDYNIRPTYTGIRICGYVFYHDRVLLSKRNKQDLARCVNKLQKKGFSEEDIRIKQASRFGYAKHVNCIHLLKSLGMEKSLGKIIKNHRIRPPFAGMTSDQKLKFSQICRMLVEPDRGSQSWNKKVFLEDYVIEESKIEKTKVTVSVPDSSGNMQNVIKMVPGKVLAIKFKKILKTSETFDDDGTSIESYVFEKNKDSMGNPTIFDAEYYAYTGSKILIDQAEHDFTHDDLPSPTVIQQFQGKNGQTFFKFT
jgi:hypothetical protein